MVPSPPSSRVSLVRRSTGTGLISVHDGDEEEEGQGETRQGLTEGI